MIFFPSFCMLISLSQCLSLNSWLSVQTELRAKSVTQRLFIGCSCCNPYSLEVVQISANNAARRTVKTRLNFGYAKQNVALWKEDTGPVKKRNESTFMILQQQVSTVFGKCRLESLRDVNQSYYLSSARISCPV